LKTTDTRPAPRILVKQDTGIHHFFAPCPRGLASVLAEELAELGAEHTEPADAGVAFTGPFDLIYTTNLYSRIASRILWRVAQFPYKNEDDVYHGANAVRWHQYFTADRTFKVETNAHRSPVKSLDFITLRVKDAIADHFRSASGRRPSVAPRDPDIRVHAFLDEKLCTLYIDTSGEPLFKRGRRDHVGEAPLKKNLAAGILRLAKWRPGIALLDPMCGAGTFLSEAAEISLGRAAGRERAFGFEKLARFNAQTWDRMLANAKKAEKPVEPLPIHGSDLYGRSLGHAALNLREAGLEEAVKLKQVNLLELGAPAAHGAIVTNPPYGVRLGEKEKLAEFYPELGDALKKKFSGWTAYIFSGDPDLAKLIRLQPSRKTVLFNGALECRLYEYRMVPGGNRPGSKPGAGARKPEAGPKANRGRAPAKR
jgi:putative N6-adenine-specific DNA methylase